MILMSQRSSEKRHDTVAHHLIEVQAVVRRNTPSSLPVGSTATSAPRSIAHLSPAPEPGRLGAGPLSLMIPPLLLQLRSCAMQSGALAS